MNAYWFSIRRKSDQDALEAKTIIFPTFVSFVNASW